MMQMMAVMTSLGSPSVFLHLKCLTISEKSNINIKILDSGCVHILRNHPLLTAGRMYFSVRALEFVFISERCYHKSSTSHSSSVPVLNPSFKRFQVFHSFSIQCDFTTRLYLQRLCLHTHPGTHDLHRDS